MFTSRKFGRMVFICFYFDKILTHANAIDRMHVNARENEPLITFLAALFLVFNNNFLQAATRETRLQMWNIEQKHRMTSCTWGRGCPTKSVIDHRTWSIIGHSTISISWHGCIRLIISLYVLPTMSSIRDPRWSWYLTEKCLPDSHLPFVYVVILFIFPLWRTGETNSLGKTSKILFWMVMPTFRKSCLRPWLHGLKNQSLVGSSSKLTLGGKHTRESASFW